MYSYGLRYLLAVVNIYTTPLWKGGISREILDPSLDMGNFQVVKYGDRYG